MNNEQMQAVLQKMLKRLDLVVTGVLIVLLTLTGYLYLAESSYTLSQPDPPAPRQWNIKLPMQRLDSAGPPREAANQKDYDRVSNYFFKEPTPISADETARRLIVVKMFDIVAVDDEALTQQLNQRYNEAEGAFSSGNLDRALSIVEEILAQNPNHRQAGELRNSIRARRGQ